MSQYRAFIDGDSRGNPGPSGIGGVVYCGERKVFEISEYIGETTNNVAEYTALLSLLKNALTKNIRTLHICSDSQLLVFQLQGKYQVRHEHLIPLKREVDMLKKQFTAFTIEHIRRAYNKEADALANRGIDQKEGRDGY